MQPARRSKYLLGVLLLTLLVVMAVPGWAQDEPQRDPSRFRQYTIRTEGLTAANKTISQAVRMPDGRIQVNVVLADQPAYLAYIAAGGRANRAAADLAATAQRRLISAAQANFLSAAGALGATAISRTNFLTNSVTVAIQPAQLGALRALPGVVAVYPNRKRERADTQIPGLLGAPRAWDATRLGGSFTGKDIVVAVIDDGIDYTHTHFGGPGDFGLVTDDTIIETALTGIFPAPYPIANIGDPKVIGGYDYVGNDFTGANAPAPDPNPFTCSTLDGFIAHGTGAGSFIGGWGVNADGTTYTGPYNGNILTGYPQQTPAFRIGPGIAPEVAILGMRIFGCDGFTTDALIVRAIEDSVAGGVDTTGDSVLDITFEPANVINMSLSATYGGGGAGELEDLAINAAVEADVIVVASASNEGDSHYVTGSPAGYRGAISVAASINRSNYFAPVRADQELGQFFGSPGAGPAATVTAQWVIAEPRNACGPLTNAAEAANKIVVVFFNGACSTRTSGNNVEAANGVGMLVVGVINIFGAENIPSLGTSEVIWRQARALLRNNRMRLELVRDLAPLYGIADFSARGPARNAPTYVKPDVAAPGVNGVAAAGGTGNDTYLFGGTSQAAPVISGVAALIRQKYPTYSATEIKALIVNTSTTDLFDILDSQPVLSPQRQGSGQANIPAALNTRVIAYDTDSPLGVSISFGYQDVPPGQTLNLSRSVTLENKGTAPVTYNARIITRSNIPGVRFRVNPQTVTVPPGGTAQVTVRLVGTPHVPNAGAPSDPTLDLFGGDRYFFPEESGYLEFRSAGNPRLRVPLWAAPRPAATVSAVDTMTINQLAGVMSIPLSGPGVNTGPNTPDDIISIVSAFELIDTSPEAPGTIAPDSDLAAVGVAHDVFSGVSYFAHANYGEWETPVENFFQIYLDLDQNPTQFNPYEFILVACYAGNFDVLEVCFVDVKNTFGAGAGALLALAQPFYLNSVAPGLLNTYPFNTNVLVVPFPVVFLDFVYNGLTFNDTAFDFAFVTDSIDNFPDGDLDVVLGTSDFFNPLVAPVVGGDGMPASISGNGLNANLRYDFSLAEPDDLPAILLIHHHNAGAAGRYEIVQVQAGVPDNEFFLIAPANNGFFRFPGIIQPVWQHYGAETYRFVLFQLSGTGGPSTVSNDGRIGLVVDETFTAAVDDDPLECLDGVCILFVSALTATLPTGTYSWTVEGISSLGGTAEAANGPFGFQVNRSDFELLNNGGFEIDSNNDRVPDGWVRVGPGARRCREGDGDNSNCGYFVNRPGARLTYTVPRARLSSLEVNGGDVLIPSARVRTNNLGNARVIVIVNYVDPTAGENENGVDRFSFPLPTNTAGVYTDLDTSPITLAGRPRNIRFQIVGNSNTGNFLIDNVSLLLTGPDYIAGAAAAPPVELLPLPEAPADMRGVGSD